MGWMDTIKNAVSEAAGSISASAIPGAINQVYPGGLNGLLKQLQETGYGQQVESWLGHGPNDPITTDDLRNALNNQQVKDMAEKLGIPADKVLDGLSKALPEAVDKQSPDGQMPAPPSNPPS